MRALPLLILLAGCAETAAKPPHGEVIEDCPAAVAAEKTLAAKERREPVPIIQKGKLITNLFDERNRPRVTFAMATEANSASLEMLARISVRVDGSVAAVEVLKGSGSRSFDQEVTEKMKTWTHRPWAMNCHPVPYVYPMHWRHKFSN